MVDLLRNKLGKKVAKKFHDFNFQDSEANSLCTSVDIMEGSDDFRDGLKDDFSSDSDMPVDPKKA